MSDEPAFFLGIDAGGSRCRGRLCDAAGAVIGVSEAGPANARIGLERLKSVILEAAEAAFANAGLDPSAMRRTRAGLGIAGISRPGIRGALEDLEFPFAGVEFETDAAIANLGAHCGEDGAILILGTGSVGYIRVAGLTTTIGGYGFPISDEGSGAALGLSAMRHALRALDGRTRTTPLSIAVTAHFGDDTARAIAWMDQASPKDYAEFAPLVMDCAERNDAIARSIVEEAARHVERFVETIFDKGAPRCALVGGLAARMRPWLRERTTAQLCEAKGDALDGALLLAGLQKAGVQKCQSAFNTDP